MSKGRGSVWRSMLGAFLIVAFVGSRKYRMNKEAFWLLLDIVRPHSPGTGEDKKSGGVPNGPITHAHEPLTSVWFVVDAIHASSQLDIKFPESYTAQAECVQGFKSKSSVNIDCCLGAIDGMLVWMNKLTISDQASIGFGPSKFFCGAKMKYGLNLMGVCDSRRRFKWVEINMLGSASDFYAFV
eukprot:scaffold45715_cov37-Cyclotella_meneghiniana.AAC.1